MGKKNLILSIFVVFGTANADEETIIKDNVIKADIQATIVKTIGLLKSLDVSEKYGSISWGNSLTIGSAIGKLTDSLEEIKEINVSKIEEYTSKMKEYFKDYIVEDLNGSGLKEYGVIMKSQEDIRVRAKLSAEYNIRSINND